MTERKRWEELRRLSLPSFRRRLLECQDCFPRGGCRHHEDVAGGYGTQSPIAVVGINPQASDNDEVYQIIQTLSVARKLKLSDRVLEILATGESLGCIDRRLEGQTHKGLADWLPRAAEHFGVGLHDLAKNFVFLECYKHATPGLAQLNVAQVGRCPSTWLLPQLERLAPRLILVCGRPGRDIVAKLLMGTAHAAVKNRRVRELHGNRDHKVKVGPRVVPLLFTYAISRRTDGCWRSHPKGNFVKRVIKQALA